ncbi:hypothetical protein Tco_1580816, partial [Tanacetum coccineum]
VVRADQLAWEKFFEIQHAFREKQHQQEDIQELLRTLLKDLQIISDELAEYINPSSWNCPAFYDDDDEDEHLDTIPETESDEVIKSSVEDLVPIPSESKGISDGMCDVPLCDHPTPLEASKDHSEVVVNSNDDYSSSDDDSPYCEDIDYVEASPPDSKLASLEVVEIVIPEDGGIDHF